MPGNINSTPSPEHVGICIQLLMEGMLIAGVSVSVFVEIASGHAPFPFTVNIIVTLPAALSAALGV